jgi:hypothetical protein
VEKEKNQKDTLEMAKEKLNEMEWSKNTQNNQYYISTRYI